MSVYWRKLLLLNLDVTLKQKQVCLQKVGYLRLGFKMWVSLRRQLSGLERRYSLTVYAYHARKFREEKKAALDVLNSAAQE